MKTRSLKLRNVHNGLITEIHQHEVLYTYEGSEYQYQTIRTCLGGVPQLN